MAFRLIATGRTGTRGTRSLGFMSLRGLVVRSPFNRLIPAHHRDLASPSPGFKISSFYIKAQMDTLANPLTINLKQQTDALISQLPSGSKFLNLLASCDTPSTLLSTISALLAEPSLTNFISNAFQPLLVDLCARWLQSDEDAERRFIALCLLIQPHEELFEILSKFLRKNVSCGPLGFFPDTVDFAAISPTRLQRIMLAYYRLLDANGELPNQLLWPLNPLSKLIWAPGADPAARLLAIRCYALQTRMGEGERVNIEKEIFRELWEADCPLDHGENIDETIQVIDGWLVSVLESKRISDSRSYLANNSRQFYVQTKDAFIQPIHPSDLSPLTVNIFGIMLLKSPGESLSIPLVPTSTAVSTLQKLATHYSLRLPTLLSSPPSSGKSLFLQYLSDSLYPGMTNQVVSIHLSDNSLDARSLLGSYISSVTTPGSFEWKEGVLIRAMKEGKWVLLEDIDRASNEVLGIIKPLVESQGPHHWIGARATIDVATRGKVTAAEGFALFATRSVVASRNGTFPAPTFLGSSKFHEIVISSPSSEELYAILENKFPRFQGGLITVLISLWLAIRALGSPASTREIGLRDLERFCIRLERLLPYPHVLSGYPSDTAFSNIIPNLSVRAELYAEARDVFFGAGTTTATARAHLNDIATLVAEHLTLDDDRKQWVLNERSPEFHVQKDANGVTIAVSAGRITLPALTPLSRPDILSSPQRPFALHRPAKLLLSRIGTAISLQEPVLLTGETGTGKTSVITHLAGLLHRPLVSLNLSHQTEASDLIGGFKPIDARVPGSILQDRFLDLFGATFSRRKNEKFEQVVRKVVAQGKWRLVVDRWRDTIKLAQDKIIARKQEDTQSTDVYDGQAPRKRRKVKDTWDDFAHAVDDFDVQHVQAKGKLAFSFVEGPLIKALRSGTWILLDEINLASPETLECISSLLQGPTASITLTEQGSLEPVPRHPDFRLFACMNPATDVGKKDLAPNIRSRFCEIDVPPPDADRQSLLSIVKQYIGDSAVGDMSVIMNVAEFYVAVKQLADSHKLADGSNHHPHYSMRTLARALTFASDVAPMYGLRRAIWEGCLMAFTMALDASSAQVVMGLAQRHLLAGVPNPRSLLMKEPASPLGRSADDFCKFGPFYLEKGSYPVEVEDHYVMTPSVQTKLIDLARIITTRRFPVLIEGPTSSGKTSSVEYLARRTGHRFVRINNHEHTDIQEYIGSYVTDPTTGKFVFKDGLLVRALRSGDWIVLDELNLAPTDVLEALNRLLDDNRELVIPETQEVVRPHPHFMLFATQNPPGLYAGRKILSRAFRNRFLEVHFEDVPQAELETILCERSRIAPSYGRKIVEVFQELQKRRQAGRVFESKHAFATLRDLFRWAGRDAIGYQQLADNGYMLLAERARRTDDKLIVKEVIESVMKVRIDEQKLYNIKDSSTDVVEFLGCSFPSSSNVVWTKAMRRLHVLVSRAMLFREPVLLVGETGSGKTSICQVYAEAVARKLYSLNCHQNTETADLLGGLRPVRNRSLLQAEAVTYVKTKLTELGLTEIPSNPEAMMIVVDKALRSNLDEDSRSALQAARSKLLQLSSVFEWTDGPLVESMRSGDVFLLDEISLADDSVLERLNSVLEPARTLVLAERGGDNPEQSVIIATDSFRLIATMNPGGDYGKKELSPALRNRFTEIWVPALDDRQDLELIIDSMWISTDFRVYTRRLLDFAYWLCEEVSDKSMFNLRDVLAWVTFTNAMVARQAKHTLSLNSIFHHAANMTFIDGLASAPQLSSYSMSTLQRLKLDAVRKLHDLVPLNSTEVSISSLIPEINSKFVRVGEFALDRGSIEPSTYTFSFRAPTTLENAMRIFRACQVSKPILLEGSPGVGKTTLISALANICGHHLHRINLSDQTDLMDLFGSDLPVEGGAPGEFAWKDAEFLTALQEGHWVLLDEMNLAPQTVLEGLNAVLDHRGTVYIPELGRSFSRHPQFRIFAAQNPLQQGGGRKGLPKSFVNRFTKVYVDQLTPGDLLLVCQQYFPQFDQDRLQAMIDFNSRLELESSGSGAFARDGSPWEFNLRDILRWASASTQLDDDIIEHLDSIYTHRFRTISDREHVRRLFEEIFGSRTSFAFRKRPLLLTEHQLQIGKVILDRANNNTHTRPLQLLHSRLPALKSLLLCVSQGHLSIVTGGVGCGKTSTLRFLAQITGNVVEEVSIHAATDTADLLGSFEQSDIHGRFRSIMTDVSAILQQYSKTSAGSKLCSSYEPLRQRIGGLRHGKNVSISEVKHIMDLLINLSGLPVDLEDHKQEILSRASAFLSSSESQGGFEWVDGPLVVAMKQGTWLVLDGANLCNPSVLDRLNSVCEPNGSLSLTERGHVNGTVQVIKPHPNFRLFMTVDPRFGELSRAMRNRGIEMCLCEGYTRADQIVIQEHMRLPSSENVRLPTLSGDVVQQDWRRRGLVSLGHQTLLHPPIISPSVDSALFLILPHSATLLSSLIDGDLRLHASMQFLSRVVVTSYSQLYKRLMASYPESSDGYSQSIEGSVLRLCESLANEKHVGTLLKNFNIFSRGFTDLNIDLRASQSSNMFWRFYLLASLCLSDHTTKIMPAHFNAKAHSSDEADSIIDCLNKLGRTILDTGRGILQANPSDGGHIYRICAKMIETWFFLEAVLKRESLDLSAVQAAVIRVSDELRDTSQLFSSTKSAFDSLSKAISSTSGLGLTSMWSSTLHLPSLRERTPQMIMLESLIQNAHRTTDFELSVQIFQLMSLYLLSPDSQQGTTRSIENISNTLAMKLPSISIFKESVTQETPLILAAELSLLAALDFSAMNLLPLRNFIEKVTTIPGRSPARFTSYQLLIWAEEAKQATLPALHESNIRFMRALWETNIQGVDYTGPSTMFLPSILHQSIQITDRKSVTLSTMLTHKKSIESHESMIMFLSQNHEDRTQQFLNYLIRSIFLLAMSFAPSFQQENIQSIIQILAKGFEKPNKILEVIEFMKGSSYAYFSECVSQTLSRPAGELATAQDRPGTISALGHAWISLSRLTLELFIPDSPVDPAAVKRSGIELMQREQTLLEHQIQLHKSLESFATGDDHNCVIDFLVALRDANSPSNTNTTGLPPRDFSDVQRLRKYWLEVKNFLLQMISRSRIDELVESIYRGDQTSRQREEVLQESLKNFIQRLDSAYSEYRDLSSHLFTAILQLQLGLRLISYASTLSASSASLVRTAEAVCIFPSIRSATTSVSLAASTPGPVSFRHLMLQLHAMPFMLSAGVAFESLAENLERSYQQVLGLWLIDRAKDESFDRSSQSLYRQSSSSYDANQEIIAEEEDFLSLFPDFEAALGDSIDRQVKSSPKLRGHLVERSDMISLVQTHLAIAEHLHGRQSRTGVQSHQFWSERKLVAASLAQAHISELPDSLDLHSLPFQIKLLDEYALKMDASTIYRGVSYNFYADANPPELGRASELVSSLVYRLEVLIKEWPDQMVLQHLKDRCMVILSMDLHSPIAKVLVAMEQLLLHTEDWEMYANRENTLRVHRDSIIGLIVDWRKLELASWHGLLQMQEKSFVEQSAESWFHIYDVAVRGCIDASDRSALGEPSFALDDHLRSLVPLLDEFLVSGSLGVYEFRLQLLKSFAIIIKHLSNTITGHHQVTLRRACQVFDSASSFYSTFLPKIKAHLAEQRQPLEKEIRDLIKLASWKDINVHALKQSAQRTHHQLYKTIRKFRDLMRQPVAALLSVPVPGDMEKPTATSNDITELTMTVGALPSRISTSVSAPEHLAKLEHTLARFNDVANGRLLPFMSTVQPEAVDELAVEIITISRTLSGLGVPQGLSSEKAASYRKTLLVRKRKAFSDLFKELKRVGLSSSIKPEVLQHHTDVLWIREQPMLETLVDSKAEKYFNRLLGALPDLRANVPKHHPDLNIRELQRGVTFVESGFSLALGMRSSYITAHQALAQVQGICKRLAMLKDTRSVSASGHDVSTRLVRINDVMGSLGCALEELLSFVIQKKSSSDDRITDQLAREIQEASSPTTTLRQQIDIILSDIRLTQDAFLLPDEAKCIAQAKALINQIQSSAKRWQDLETGAQPFVRAFADWTSSSDFNFADPTTSSMFGQTSADPTVPNTPAATASDDVIDSLLVIMQNLVKRADAAATTAAAVQQQQERDHYMRDDARAVMECTRLLQLDPLAGRLNALVSPLLAARRNATSVSQQEEDESLARVLPFLDQYLQLANRQLALHASWLDALFKFEYVLVSVIGNLARDGFCQPPEQEGEETGDGHEAGADASGGVGLGEGTGAQNVSEQITDESQVEGLKGQEEEEQSKQDRKDKGDGDDNTIEMSEDFGGALEDVPEDKDEDAGDEDESEDDEDQPDEKVDKLDKDDPNAVDEKMWGAEGKDGEDENEESTAKEGAQEEQQQQQKESEMVAKSGKKEKSKKEDKENGDAKQQEHQDEEENEPQEEEETMGDDRMDEEQPNAGGAPMDEHVPEAGVLDLPEEMDLGEGEEQQDDGMKMDDDLEDMREDEAGDVDENGGGEDGKEGPQETIDAEEHPDERMEGETGVDGEDETAEDGSGDGMEVQDRGEEEEEKDRAEDREEANQGVAPPDMTQGEGDHAADEDLTADVGKSTSTGIKGQSTGAGGEDQGMDDTAKSDMKDEDQPIPENSHNATTTMELTGADSTPQGQNDQSRAPSKPRRRELINNPLRSLGDAMREIYQNFEEILSAQENDQQPPSSSEMKQQQQTAEQLEYIRPDETADEDDMQALGPSGEEQAPKLENLKILDDEDKLAAQDESVEMPMDIDEPIPNEAEKQDDGDAPLEAELRARALQEDVVGAVTDAEVRAQKKQRSDDDAMDMDEDARAITQNASAEAEEIKELEPEPEDAVVERELREWQAQGLPAEGAEHIWRLYESLTHDLAYALCEQLRLILEPTQATRLRGDYRTGKRLNMKKIIPYIASDYTKDKIWLRRTRPSAREYQVLLAIDDSRSMAESRSVHLAYETLALVAKALGRLEVGDVAIAKFGQAVEILHGFDAGAFSDQAGAKVMSAFGFDQKATNVLALVERSLAVLDAARNRRAMSSATAAELWQLEIIISDGICQDHERLRTVLRKAKEQRVMIVFVIIDSLHSAADATKRGKAENSILTMNQVTWKNVNGTMDMQLERYLDSFPFEYYVVLRSVEALPDVLSSTLKQFFERVSGE